MSIWVARHFYRHYRDALIKEEYIMSSMDNCLFYKIREEEITFIVLFVNDTLIFSKRQIDIDQFVVCMNRNYELTLDTKADSFLGINIIGHNEDGTVTLTQPKLLQKLFKDGAPGATQQEKGQNADAPIWAGPFTQQRERTVTAHSSHDVPTPARALDVLNQESTRHHGSCLFRCNQVNQPHGGRLPAEGLQLPRRVTGYSCT
jgi:hypothetical protein